MDYIKFFVDKKGVRYGVDIGTGKKTRLDAVAEQDEQAADDAAPVETIDENEG